MLATQWKLFSHENDEVLTHATDTDDNVNAPQKHMPNERSQKQGTLYYCMILFI